MIETMKILLEAGAEVNAVNIRRELPLHVIVDGAAGT